MRPFLTVPNVITSANVVAGFVALLLAQTSILLAAGLVVLAAVLDVFDGLIARRTSRASDFGANLDSLADIVSFGVVPAAALMQGPLRSLPVLGAAAAAVFLLSGAWRLARFPLVKARDCFVGLPIPLAGVLVMGLAVWGPPVAIALVATLTLSVLMASSLPFPTIATARRGATRVATTPVRVHRARALRRPRRRSPLLTVSAGRRVIRRRR